MRKDSTIAAVIMAISAVVMLAGLYGWVNNLLMFAHSNAKLVDFDTMLILRFIGIFLAPLGAVLGYV